MESPFKISGIRRKTLNLLLVLTSLLGYLEWGTGNKMFLFQGELLIITKLFTNPESVIHPFILLPLFGQVLLIITLFQKQPGKFLTIIGLISTALLLTLLFIIGIMSLNYKILLSSIPFMATAVITTIQFRSKKR